MNVPTAPGATVVSTVVVGRFAVSHPTAISVNAVESLTIPRFTCLPGTPRCHVSVPVFLNWTVYDAVAPGRSVGYAPWLTQAL